jgi:MerR family transcriptional regulator, light-induced transcriptional regulator
LNNFSIAQLQQFSGIKAHTIRMWEQRYDALRPSRTEGNTRFYDGSQLRRLLNIVSLLQKEYKVSELCSMPDEKLFRLLEAEQAMALPELSPYEYHISQIIAAALDYDEAYFDKIFSSSILRIGMRETYVQIIYPVLVRLGLMWARNVLPPAQEHFISGLFRQKFLAAADALPPPKSNKDSWLLFLSENEFHETGLLFASFLIRKAGHKVIYLGSNVPLSSLEDAVQQVDPDNLLFFMVNRDDPSNDTIMFQTLAKRFQSKKIFVACDELRLNNIKTPKILFPLHSVEDLEKVLT